MTQECDCCKHQVHAVDDIGLCVSCEITQTVLTSLADKVDLGQDDAINLASDIAELVQSIILERLIDHAMPPMHFIADLRRDMVRRKPVN
jgi:hypothetical protein